MPQGQITEHFDWGEARCDCGDCSGWGDAEAQIEIRRTADWAEEIRKILGWPIHVNSWYRCEAYQRRINPEVVDSQHCLGRAIDIAVKQLSPSTVQKILAKRRDLIIGLGRYSGFTHVDRRGGPPATWRG